MHEKRKLGWIGYCAFLCLFVALPAGCRKKESAPASAQILRISQRNEPADLDPARVTLPDEFFIIRALSEGLVRPAPGGGQEPAIAERWEISPEGFVYTFHLRPAARWSNDEPVTAFDFVESYRRELTPATAAPKAGLFFLVKNARAFATGAITDFAEVGFHAADAQTLVVVLEQPSPLFLAYAASGPWIPVNPRVVAAHGRDWTRPENFVGNGPFTLAEWRPHQRIVVRKNPGYFEAARVRLDEIDFVALDNEPAAANRSVIKAVWTRGRSFIGAPNCGSDGCSSRTCRNSSTGARSICAPEGRSSAVAANISAPGQRPCKAPGSSSTGACSMQPILATRRHASVFF